jgi:hypothetical protein
LECFDSHLALCDSCRRSVVFTLRPCRRGAACLLLQASRITLPPKRVTLDESFGARLFQASACDFQLSGAGFALGASERKSMLHLLDSDEPIDKPLAFI